MPAYISTVDSGNLAGYLLTLRSGLYRTHRRARRSSTPDARRPRRRRRAVRGVADGRARRPRVGRRTRVQDGAGRAPRPARGAARDRSATGSVLLEQLADRMSAVGVLLHEIEEAAAERGRPGARRRMPAQWLDRAGAAIAQRQADLEQLAPWATAIERAGGRRCRRPDPRRAWRRSCAWCHAGVGRARRRAPAHASCATRIDRSRDARRGSDRPRDAARRSSPTTSSRRPSSDFSSTAERQLFSIGFSVTDGRLDASYYDTLASEARLASFVAIATGQIPHEHWFKLGRSLTPTGTRARCCRGAPRCSSTSCRCW